MHVPVSRDPSASLQIRRDKYELMFRVLGATGQQARADLLKVDRKTIQRADQGSFGVPFIARLIRVLREHRKELAVCGLEPTLDELFVVPEDEASEAAA